MHLHNKIFAFLSVTVLLVFAGRISKVDLFHAYFKTIQDVEIRNSQDHKSSTKILNLNAGAQEQVSSEVSSTSNATLSFNVCEGWNILQGFITQFNKGRDIIVQSFPYILSNPPMAP